MYISGGTFVPCCCVPCVGMCCFIRRYNSKQARMSPRFANDFMVMVCRVVLNGIFCKTCVVDVMLWLMRVRRMYLYVFSSRTTLRECK